MSHRLFRTCAMLVVVGAMGCIEGCGGDDTAGTVSVSGTVTLDGKPVDAAAVVFLGNGGARLATSTTDNAGKFKLRAAPGKNGVTVSKASENAVVPSVNPDEPQLMPSGEEYKKMPVPKPGIPSKYSDPKTSGLAFEVVDGMDVEIALSSK